MSKFYIISILIILCNVICYIICLISFFKFKNSDYKYVASIGNNWSTGPMLDAIPSHQDCPSDKSSAINELWQGTIDGCLCGTFEIERGSCSEDEWRCTDINSISPMPVRLWKEKNICVTRGSNYLDLKIVKTKNGCGAGFTPCGIIDSLNQILCYPDRIGCPYNYIKFLDSKEVIPTDRTYTVIPLGTNGEKGKFILSNQNTSGKIINQFKIDDNIPCLDPDYKNLNTTPYLLEKSFDKNSCLNKISDKIIDEEYIKIDSETYNQLYSDNNIIKVLLSLPDFQKYNYLSSSTNLYYKNYIGIDTRCREDILQTGASSKIVSDLVKIDGIVDSIIIVTAVGLFFCLVGFLFIIMFTMMLCCNFVDMNEKLIFLKPLLTMSLPSFIISSILVNKVTNLKNDMSLFADPLCTDSITSSVVAGFIDNTSSGISLGIWYLLFAILSMILNIYGFFL